LLGGEGQAFKIAQTRLGGGRLHHAMRTVGAVRRLLDMMAERAASRTTKGSLLADKQGVQEMIGRTWLDLQQFRLLVLHAAWTVDQVGGSAARTEIAAVKVMTPQVYTDAAYRCMKLHGALGVSNEMPIAGMWLGGAALGLADGPTEVHMTTIAKHVLKNVEPTTTGWPSEHLPERREAARARYADILERTLTNE
jgi:acyl-CoA dehydrogenase